MFFALGRAHGAAIVPGLARATRCKAQTVAHSKPSSACVRHSGSRWRCSHVLTRMFSLPQVQIRRVAGWLLAGCWLRSVRSPQRSFPLPLRSRRCTRGVVTFLAMLCPWSAEMRGERLLSLSYSKTWPAMSRTAAGMDTRLPCVCTLTSFRLDQGSVSGSPFSFFPTARCIQERQPRRIYAFDARHGVARCGGRGAAPGQGRHRSGSGTEPWRTPPRLDNPA